MATSPQCRIYNLSLWEQLSTTCSNAAEVTKWAAPSCNRPQPTMDNGVREGRSNLVAVITPTLYRTVARPSIAPGMGLRLMTSRNAVKNFKIIIIIKKRQQCKAGRE